MVPVAWSIELRRELAMLGRDMWPWLDGLLPGRIKAVLMTFSPQPYSMLLTPPMRGSLESLADQ